MEILALTFADALDCDWYCDGLEPGSVCMPLTEIFAGVDLSPHLLPSMLDSRRQETHQADINELQT